jgi:hypothetical protein
MRCRIEEEYRIMGLRIGVRGEAGRLLPVLFPVQYPQMENQAL